MNVQQEAIIKSITEQFDKADKEIVNAAKFYKQLEELRIKFMLLENSNAVLKEQLKDSATMVQVVNQMKELLK